MRTQKSKSDQTERPWLDANGQLYSNAALKEISKGWSSRTWEHFLSETVDKTQLDALVAPYKYDLMCEEADLHWSEIAVSGFSAAHVSALLKAMRRLTKQQSQILRHLYWDGMSIRQTAQQMGVSKTLVSIQKDNSLKKLKGLIEKELANFPYSERQDDFELSQKGSRDEDIREIYLEDIKGSYLK